METTLGKVLWIADNAQEGKRWADTQAPHGVEITVLGAAGDPLEPWEQGGFDLVLVDVAAQEDGLDLCRRLRARSVNPILLLCPHGDELCVLSAYRAGADECVLKPVAPAVLLAKVKAWLRHRWAVRVEALRPIEGGGIRLDPQHHQVLIGSGAAGG